jgi:hypothetical protein
MFDISLVNVLIFIGFCILAAWAGVTIMRR